MQEISAIVLAKGPKSIALDPESPRRCPVGANPYLENRGGMCKQLTCAPCRSLAVLLPDVKPNCATILSMCGRVRIDPSWSERPTSNDWSAVHKQVQV